MRQRRDCNFSFAGLKTAVRLAITKAGGDLVSPLEDKQRAADIAASFQHVAVTHLEERLRRAVKVCTEDGTCAPSRMGKATCAPSSLLGGSIP